MIHSIPEKARYITAEGLNGKVQQAPGAKVIFLTFEK